MLIGFGLAQLPPAPEDVRVVVRVIIRVRIDGFWSGFNIAVLTLRGACTYVNGQFGVRGAGFQPASLLPLIFAVSIPMRLTAIPRPS